jgi:hypothetical protein
MRADVRGVFRVLLIAAMNGALASRATAAIAHVQDIGIGSVTAGTTVTINVGTVVGVNDLIVVEVASDVNTAVPAVADSRANSYTQVVFETTSASLSAVGFFAFATTALLSGDQISVTFPVAVNGVATASEFSGAGSSSSFAGNPDPASASFATPAALGILGGELLLGWVALNGSSSSVTQDPTFTPMLAVSANGVTAFPTYKLAPAPGGYSFSGTIGASEQSIAQIYNFQVAAPPTPTPTPSPTAVVPVLESRGTMLLIFGLAAAGLLLIKMRRL